MPEIHGKIRAQRRLLPRASLRITTRSALFNAMFFFYVLEVYAARLGRVPDRDPDLALSLRVVGLGGVKSQVSGRDPAYQTPIPYTFTYVARTVPPQFHWIRH